MKPWLSDYTSALNARDRHEKANIASTNAYTKLADGTAQLRSTAPPPTPTPPPSKSKWSSPKVEPADTTELTKLRADLLATQTARATLSSQVTTLTAELDLLTNMSKKQASRIASLERERGRLERSLRDRDEEIKQKARLVAEVQDEMLTLHMDLNVTKEQMEGVKRENAELVERWMREKGREAEEMNVRSRWE